MKARHLAMAAVLLLVALLAWSGTALADQTAPVDPSVLTELDAANGAAVPVIVYAPGHVDDVAADLPIPTASTPLDLIGAVATTVDGQEVADLASQPYVQGIAADVPIFSTDYVDTLDVTNTAIGLGALTSPFDGGLDGSGVTVAVVDSGSDADNPDLADASGNSRVIGWVDFVKGKRRPYDDGGHGTFVDGLIAGNGSASVPVDQGGRATQQFRGVAPGVDIVSLKVLDRYGEGNSSALIAAIGWAIRHKAQYDIRVLNISVEGDVTCATVRDPMALAVEAAWKAGIVVVCAAGNDGDFGPGSILSPGNDPYVITVGALDTGQTADRTDDTVAHYSSIGPTMFDEFAKPDLVAPGNKLVSLRARGSYIDRTYPQNRVAVSSYEPGVAPCAQPDYFIMSGTSASAPVVSGAVALMLERYPRLTPDDVKARLMASADRVAAAKPLAEGAGTLDVPGALASRAHSDGYALSADLGDGDTILPPDVELQWQKYAWSKYAWSKYAWSKYAWSKYAWSKYAWSKYAWSKYAWSKYAWSVVIDGQ